MLDPDFEVKYPDRHLHSPGLALEKIRSAKMTQHPLLARSLSRPVFRSLVLFLLLISAPVLCAQGGLIGHWTFDDTLDDSAGTVHGTFSDGIPAYVAGKFGNAIALDGYNDHVVLGSSGDLNFGASTDFSVALWIKTSGWNDDASIISNKDWNSGGNTGWVIAGQAGGGGSWQWNYSGATGGRVDYDPSGPLLSDGKWHHLCVTHDRDGYARFYFDGVPQSQKDISSSTGTIDAGFPTVVGTDGAEGAQWPYWFAGDVDDLRVYDKVLSQSEIDALQGPAGQTVRGASIQFTGPYTAVVRWDTAAQCNSIVEYGTTEALGMRQESSTPATAHEVTLDELEYRTSYYFRVGYNEVGGDIFSDVHTFDNSINYTRFDCSGVETPYTEDPAMTALYEAAADRIVTESGITKGYCLVYGCFEGQLAFELAKRSDLVLVGVDIDPASVAVAREKLMEAGVYGHRIKIWERADLDTLPFTRYFFNLVVSDRMIVDGVCTGSAAEMYRVLRPSGGRACFGQPPGCPNQLSQSALEGWLNAGSVAYTIDTTNGLWADVVRPKLPNAGEWPRQYGWPNNAANSADDLEGATRADQMAVQWLGSPGSDFGADRNPRMPPPVMKNGRLFHQGLDRLVAIDAYNGSIYWSLEIPELLRVNTPRDGGYYAADDSSFFLAMHDSCWRLDGDTGLRIQTYTIPLEGYEWGYVAVSEDSLYGSAQFENAHFTNIWGGSGWYDATSGSQTDKVCSRYFVAFDKSTGALSWYYNDGVIINSTITAGGGRIYFVECRNQAIKDLTYGRIGDVLLWSDQYLVALDEDTGAKLWEEPIDTADGIVVFYGLYSPDVVCIASSETKYYLYAYDAASGNFLWSKNHNWPNNNHGGHMQHPVIAGNTVYLEPRGYDLFTGSLITSSMGSHGGCATYGGSTGALVYRGNGGKISMWDINSGSVTSWEGLRPACWLSTITGGGMVLCPEGGGGCSCNGWINTSVGFVRDN